MLENNKCYLLDCGSEVFVWVGRTTQVEDRKTVSQTVEEFVANNNRPRATRITRVTQGYETNSFKSLFDSWPAPSTAPGGEEGIGKVAAMLKQQKLATKGSAKTAAVQEEVPLLEGGGKMEVWCIDDGAKKPLPKEDIGKFHTGDCYIVLYSYHSGERREDYFLCCWIGKDSIEEDQTTAAKLANTMFNSLKGKPVQGRVYEGKEPPQFIALFQPMVILKGGLSTGYKKSRAANDLTDESYTADCVALFQISGTEVHNTKALQVDAVATSLNSTECFLLQSGSSAIFTWYGTQSTKEQQQLAAKIAELLKPGVARKHCKEGTESSAFWSALGGKESYTTTEKESNETVRDPHLYTFNLNNKGKLEVEEVYNFSQDDLLPEDILILDTHAEVFVWVGQCVDSKEKQNAFEFGQQYINKAVSLEGLSPKVPLYKVTDGNEPCFFTVFFSWDSHRATLQGNSFQKKAAMLFGATHTEDRSDGQGPRQRAEALAALTSAFNPSSESKPSAPKPAGTSQGSQRAAAVAALSSVLTAEKKTSPDGSPRKSASTTPLVTSPHSDVDPSESHHSQDMAEGETGETNGVENPATECTYSYDQLKSKSENPATGIDLKRREAYLSDEEFQTVFGMPKEAFYKLPKWKQDNHKKEVDLF